MSSRELLTADEDENEARQQGMNELVRVAARPLGRDSDEVAGLFAGAVRESTRDYLEDDEDD